MIEHIIVQMEQERGLDRAAAIADMRFHFIHQLVEQTVVKPRQSKEQLRSARIDRFLTGRYTAIPAFVGIMALVFYLTFGVIGLALQNLLEVGIDALTAAVDSTLTAWNVNAAVHSLVIDGIFTGVGSVLSFLPIIVTLFFFLSLLEDTGYMARVAFVMDKLLRRIGLSGRSIVPMLIGFGCTVPGVMASRTPALGARPQNDHPAHPLYELLGQAAHLQPVCGGLLPGARGSGDGQPLFPRHCGGHSDGHPAEEQCL